MFPHSLHLCVTLPILHLFLRLKCCCTFYHNVAFRNVYRQIDHHHLHLEKISNKCHMWFYGCYIILQIYIAIYVDSTDYSVSSLSNKSHLTKQIYYCFMEPYYVERCRFIPKCPITHQAKHKLM